MFSPPSIDVGARYDEYGRGLILYKDYAGRTESLAVPAFYSVLPTSPGPIILLSGLRFINSSEIFRLRLRETSAFTALWEGYPHRRQRVRIEAEEDHPNVEIATTTAALTGAVVAENIA